MTHTTGHSRPFAVKSLALGAGLLLAGCAEQPTTPNGPEAQPRAAVSAPVPAISSLGSWSTLTPMPTRRHEFAVGVFTKSSGATILFAIGGHTDVGTAVSRVEAYDPLTDTWTRKAPLPEALERTNGAGVIDDRIYISGGDSPRFPSKKLYVYIPRSDAWHRKADLPIVSWGGITGVIGGRLYVLTGGCATCYPRPYTHRLYRYDPLTNLWTRLPDCPHQHVLGAGGVIDSKLYVTGGEELNPDGTISISRRLDSYDPATNRWTLKSPMPTARRNVAGAVLHKLLYILGGDAGEHELALVERYDAARDNWSTVAPMPTARYLLGAGKVKGPDGVSEIAAIGGGNGRLGNLGVNEAFRP